MTDKTTVDLLKNHFDIALETPDGLKKLRELILSLAMQGKLVPQDPKDQPMRLPPEKQLQPIKADEVPFAIPKSWTWQRLGQIADYNGRKNAAPDEIGAQTWVLDLEDIEKDTSRILYRAKYSERQSKSTKSTFCKGDVLYGKLRPYLNKVVVADQDGVCTTEIVPIVPTDNIYSDFLKYLLKRPDFLAHVDELSYGVKMPRLGTPDAVNSLHPIPPLAEQKRIVAKIDQLMGLCDKLEAERNERNNKRQKIHAAAINNLLSATDKTAFSSSWNFITTNFTELYSVPENVEELKKAILQLAVMGKLVPQDSKDQPAGELLKEIGEQKRKMIREGELRKEKPVIEIKKEDIPFEIPENWSWCRLGKICRLITSGSRDWAKYYSQDGAIFVRMGNLSRGNFRLRMNSIQYVRPPRSSEGNRTRLEENDILVSITGEVGNLGLIPKDFGEAYINQHTALVRLTQRIYTEFVAYSFLSILLQDQFNAPQRGLKNSYRLSDVDNLIVPLPPLAEQKRIVAKIDQLMSLCNSLEQGIKNSTDKQTAIFNAVLAKV